jgi:hypothetical protein
MSGVVFEELLQYKKYLEVKSFYLCCYVFKNFSQTINFPQKQG